MKESKERKEWDKYVENSYGRTFSLSLNDEWKLRNNDVSKLTVSKFIDTTIHTELVEHAKVLVVFGKGNVVGGLGSGVGIAMCSICGAGEIATDNKDSKLISHIIRKHPERLQVAYYDAVYQLNELM